MKLHLGCGKRYIPGFVHIDLVEYEHVDYRQDVRSLSNFEDETAELIYACQVLQYFDYEECKVVLKEWTRVLKRGGILRLSVPDFAVISRLYQRRLVDLQHLLGTLYGKWELNGGFIYHKTTFDKPLLEKLLADFEYTEIRRWDWRKTEHRNVDDYSQAYFPHMDKANGILWNLNMQGIKK